MSGSMFGGPAATLILVLVGSPGLALPAGPASGAVSGRSFWARAAVRGQAVPGGDGLSPRFAVAVERTIQGRYAEAAGAYGAAIAAGAGTPAVYANLGEVLMADGQLVEAEASYRDAIAAASVAPSPSTESFRLDDARARSQDLVLGCLGLAVALDRDGQARAAREVMRRVVSLDPTLAVLTVAQRSNGDLFFVPSGDVYYYVGLAKALQGKREEAAAAFRSFLAQVPTSRWASQAEAHLAALQGAVMPPPTGAAPRAQRTGPRVLAVGTVLSTGGTPAPLIDAAWREQSAILDACLEAVADRAIVRAPIRLAIELAIDRRGRVTRVAVKLPPGLALTDGAPELARCLGRAVKAGLRLPPAPRGRTTRARTELLVGFPSP